MTARTLLVLTVSTLAVSASAQQPSPSTASLRGQVVSGESATPLRRARVAIVSRGESSEPVFADESGQFEAAVPPLPYTIRVTKSGFAPLEVAGQRSPGDPVRIALTRAAVLRGRVVDSIGEPGVGMSVRVRRLSPPAANPLAESVDTDDRGEFRFGNLPAGRYELRAFPGLELMSDADSDDSARAAVLRAERERIIGSQRPLSAPVVVDATAGDETAVTLVQERPAVSLPYAQVGGAISGVLLDEFGEPAERTTVRLWATRFVDGRVVLSAAGRSRTVDDLGRYRLFHIPAGRYLVVATPDPQPEPGNGAPSRFLQVYFPGRFEAGAAAEIQVDRSSEVTGIDMAVPRSRGARVYGVALSSSGSRLNGTVVLVPSVASGPVATAPTFMGNGLTPAPLSAEPAGDGTFEIRHVPPGDYALQAAATVASTATAFETWGDSRRVPIVMRHIEGFTEFVVQRLSVGDADIGPLTLTSLPTSTLGGRITVDGPGQLITPAEFAFTAVNVDPDEVPFVRRSIRTDIEVDPSGRFTITGLTGRSLIVLTRAPAGWWLKSAAIGGVNAAVEPVSFGSTADSRDDVTIVMAPSGAVLSGRVTGSADGASGTVVVFPVDPNLRLPGSRYVRFTSLGSDSRFQLNSFPPGDYYIAAVREAEGENVGDWVSPDRLATLEKVARRVTLAERETRDLELRLTNPPR